MMDTLAYAKRLRAAGVSEQQAEAHASALREATEASLPTKADLDQLDARIKADLDQLDARIKADLNTFEARIEARFATIETELRMHRWVLGFIVALQVAILAKLFL